MRAWMRPLAVLFVSLTVLPAIGQDRSTSPVRSEPGDDPELPDLSRLHPFQRVIYLSARRGTEWLWNANRADGLFVPGHVPALKAELDADHFLHQAGAAAGLARGARFAGTSRYTARARQAILALLSSTKTDPMDPGVRYTLFPDKEVNRRAAASWLILGIAELPEPGADLLEQMDQLTQFLARQQDPNGSFRPDDGQAQPPSIEEDHSALAGRALARSHGLRPAAWKLEAAQKGLRFQQTVWQKEKDLQSAPWLTCSAVELYSSTKDKAHLTLACEVADWLCTLQYGAEPRRPHWQGGFATWQQGRVVAAPPNIDSARHALALTQACRAVRASGDAQRSERYREACERALQFISTLQYTSTNTRHFADWYRPTLYGAFFASPQDGNIRVDSTQHALWAMAEYLESAAEVKTGRQ